MIYDRYINVFTIIVITMYDNNAINVIKNAIVKDSVVGYIRKYIVNNKLT